MNLKGVISNNKILSFNLTLILITILLLGCSKSSKVTRVIDGCTIIVERDGKSETVRLLGIDTLSKDNKFYDGAKMALSKLIEGKKVELEFRNPDQEERDQFGNLLCFVHLKKMNVNVEMVRQGFCHFSPDKGAGIMAQKFEKAESEARINKVGIWE